MIDSEQDSTTSNIGVISNELINNISFNIQYLFISKFCYTHNLEQQIWQKKNDIIAYYFHREVEMEFFAA